MFLKKANLHPGFTLQAMAPSLDDFHLLYFYVAYLHRNNLQLTLQYFGFIIKYLNKNDWHKLLNSCSRQTPLTSNFSTKPHVSKFPSLVMNYSGDQLPQVF